MPALYLRGISTGDFREALTALLGKDAPNLSPSVISRLTAEWKGEYDRWQARDLSARRYVYVWADGVYLQARMEDSAECMLVLIGATPEGKKELVGFQIGVRESAQSWRELLVEVKRRGLKVAPEIAIGDGALGFWKALDAIFPGAKHQRCFRNGPLVVKSPVSASPSFGAPRERAPRKLRCSERGVASRFRRRRQSLASVRGRHEDRHTMPSEETVSPSGWRGPSEDGQHAAFRLH